MTKKELDLIKEVINERIKLDDIGPVVRLITLYNRHELINDRVMERLYNWIELYNNDRFKNKREKKRMNYYINKLNEFERLLND